MSAVGYVLDGEVLRPVREGETPTHAAVDVQALSSQLTRDRLERVLDGGDNWGKLVNAFEYLTACSALLNAWPKEAA